MTVNKSNPQNSTMDRGGQLMGLHLTQDTFVIRLQPTPPNWVEWDICERSRAGRGGILLEMQKWNFDEKRAKKLEVCTDPDSYIA